MSSLPIHISSSSGSLSPPLQGLGSDEETSTYAAAVAGSITSSNRNLETPVQNAVQREMPRLPSGYRFTRYKHFGGHQQDSRRPYRYHWRKSAYCMAMVKVADFMGLGAQMVDTGFYALLRTYDASPTGETCAILGLSAHLVPQLLKPKSELYTMIKTCPLFANVSGLELLRPYNLHPLGYTIHNLWMLRSDEVLLLTLEPKGQDGKHRHQYPTANICLPGGGMERGDNLVWERTALREFSEEVGVTLDPREVSIMSSSKINLIDRQAMYFWIRVHSLSSEPVIQSKIPMTLTTGRPANRPFVIPPPGFTHPISTC